MPLSLIVFMCWPICAAHVEAIGIGESRRSEGEARAWSRDYASEGMADICRERGYKRVVTVDYTDPECTKHNGLWRCRTIGQGWCANEDPQE